MLLTLDKSEKRPLDRPATQLFDRLTVRAWAVRFQDRHTCRQLGKSRRRYPVLVSDWDRKVEHRSHSH